jgi:hypothetical protein
MQKTPKCIQEHWAKTQIPQTKTLLFGCSLFNYEKAIYFPPRGKNLTDRDLHFSQDRRNIDFL